MAAEGVQLGFGKRKSKRKVKVKEVEAAFLLGCGTPRPQSCGCGRAAGEEGHPECHYENQKRAPEELIG